ncbi:unnamed protein product [Darwinula stevensoni]|uniref:Uncharacterized protein n=1 Tax=Darwinula stevensoni TaxID=69355 RepID=A0A7R9A7J3_9CRUS|nr:unnamed protein product [Darwinula stevensoni]CAG0893644.1 unnamed protein product [Darwinula stevensoni]
MNPIRIDSPDEPFTAVRNVTSSGKIFLLGERSYMLSLSFKYNGFLHSGSKCNGDEDYDYKKVEIVEEHSLTSLEQFLSSIGGMVGLYLGVSFLGVYECVEILAIWVKFRLLKAQIRHGNL